MTGLANYYFVPVVRRGMAAALSEPASKPPTARAQLAVSVQPAGDSKPGTPITKAVELYGPGDVRGFDPRIVTRTDPTHDVGTFEPNVFPAIEFADPDFPWRYSAAAAAGGTGELAPWITLIVLDPSEFTEPERDKPRDKKDASKLPSVPWITVKDASSLPRLEHAWRWAHVQFTAESGIGLPAPSSNAESPLATRFREIEASEPERTVSRLLCARRLKPSTHYHAFVVPTFKLGVIAAGRAVAAATDNALTPAWTGTSPIDLPYYYRWEFGTSERGDFEYLVRLLEARKLSGLGIRPMDCSVPGYGVPAPSLTVAGKPSRELGLEGALKSLDTAFTLWGQDGPPAAPKDFQISLAGNLLNRPVTDLRDISIAVPQAATAAITDVQVILSWTPPDQNSPQAALSASVTFRRVRALKSATVQYGPTPAVNVDPPPKPAGTAAAGVRAQVQLGPLAPDTQYYLRVSALGTNDVPVPGRVAPFRTPARPIPTVVPPIYGRIQAARATVRVSGSQSWLDHLNLDPRHRVAGGLGALVVERQQEALMAAAWEQLGEIEAANELLRNSQLGSEAGAVVARRLSGLSDPALLRLTAPLHRRLRMPGAARGAAETIQAFVRRSSLPEAALDQAFRRIQRETGPIRRRQHKLLPSRPALIPRLADRQIVATGPIGQPEGVFRLADIPVPPPAVLAAQPRAATVTTAGRTAGSVATASKPPTGWSFSEDRITSGAIRNAVAAGAFAGTGVAPAIVPQLEAAVSGVLDGWLRPRQAPPAAPPDLPAVVLSATLKASLDPRRVHEKRMAQRLQLFGEARRAKDPLDPMVASPEFLQPMYEPLRDISNDLLLPGLEKVPQNTVALLETNRRFVEAYLIGLNHTFAGELLWRGAPVGYRATYFRQFWDVDESIPFDEIRATAERSVAPGVPDREEQVAQKLIALEKDYRTAQRLWDIVPIAAWDQLPLAKGNHAGAQGSSERLVLLVRGELLRKYPNTVVYAIEGEAGGKPALPEFVTTGAKQPILPLFSGSLPPDVWFFGFPFTEEDARRKTPKFPNGLFFVLEERVSEARFGLDEEGPARPATANDVSWAGLRAPPGGVGPAPAKVAPGEYINGWTPDDTSFDPKWAESSAAIAHITLQKPVRIAVHADRMLPPLPPPT